AAAGAEQLAALVGDDDLRPLAAGEMALDLVRKVMDVHDRALDALRGEPVEHVVDQRLAADRHQRLRQLAVERAPARAEAGGEHHGALRRGVDSWRGGHRRIWSRIYSRSARFKSSLTTARGRYTTR